MFLIDYLISCRWDKVDKTPLISLTSQTVAVAAEVRLHWLINEAQQEISNNTDKETILA